MAISENQILIGDPQGETCQAGTCFTSGAAHLFEFDTMTWQKTAKLVPERPFDNAWFGRLVTLNENLALVGAPLEVAGTFGAVYRFVACNGQWQQEARLTAGTNPRAEYAISRSLNATQTLIQQRDPRPSKIWQAAQGGFLHPVLLATGPAIAFDETAVFIGTTRFDSKRKRPIYQFPNDATC